MHGARLSSRVSESVEDIIDDELNGLIPTRIYKGFTLGRALRLSTGFINENKIPVTVSIGDPNLFTTSHSYTQSLWGLDTIDSLVLTWPDNGPDYYFDERIREFQGTGFIAMDLTKDVYGERTETFLRDAERIHLPWGIRTDGYPEWVLRGYREIDVNMVCMVHPEYSKHENRRQVLDEVKGMSVVKRIGMMYGRYYRKLLLQSKIFIALSGTDFLTQKYLEAGISGCLIIGDVPTEPTGTFVDGETMVGVPDYTRISEVIQYYLEHPTERDELASECYDRIKKNYNIREVTKDFVEALL